VRRKDVTLFILLDLNGRQSTLPMHGTVELGNGLEEAIERQLGLK
jgi:mRNA interferase HicA